MTVKHFAVCLLLAKLIGQALWAGPIWPPATGASSLVVFLTDESLYLCPLCGDRFLVVYKMIASQVRPDRLWVAVAAEKSGNQARAAALRAAVIKRIQDFLRSNDITCPVMDDAHGALRGPGGVLPAFIVFDVAAGAIRSFALLDMGLK